MSALAPASNAHVSHQCRWCSAPVYDQERGTDGKAEHPCCAFWIGQEGKSRCTGCLVSIAAARDFVPQGEIMRRRATKVNGMARRIYQAAGMKIPDWCKR